MAGVRVFLLSLCLLLPLAASDRQCESCSRDAEGRIKRSAAMRKIFKQMQPCPATGSSTGACPGYVIDHVNPLACGGEDDPENMQWQTKPEAREKDKTERITCANISQPKPEVWSFR
jgi:hypothetical protein